MWKVGQAKLVLKGCMSLDINTFIDAISRDQAKVYQLYNRHAVFKSLISANLSSNIDPLFWFYAFLHGRWGK